ncbi:MAG: NUDIX hydrolase [Verrucomicrobiales bacterium]|nr:NUDIX hydrolase [Verrucomicrobiales bacterium]
MPDPTSKASIDFERCRIEDGKGWEKLSVERILDHRYIQIEEVRYQTPARQTPVDWTVARRKSAIAVAPMLPDGRFLLIQQERYPVQRALWEFPAGQIDDIHNRENTDVILNTVHSELDEETGHQLAPDGELIPLGYFFSSQGYSDEHVYLFLAKNVVPTGKGPSPDAGESILGCRALTASELSDEIACNHIVDANTLSLFARLCAKGHIDPSD